MSITLRIVFNVFSKIFKNIFQAQQMYEKAVLENPLALEYIPGV